MGTINIDPTPAPGLGEFVVSLALVAAVWLAFFAFVRWMQTHGADSGIKKELDLFSGDSLTIPKSAAGTVANEYGTEIRQLFEDNEDAAGDASVPQSVGGLAAELKQPLQGYSGRVIYMASEVAILLPLAFVVHVAEESVAAALATPARAGHVSVLDGLAEAAANLVAIINFAGPLTAYAMTVLILFYDLLYSNAMPLAVVLAIGVIVIAIFERQTDDEDLYARLYPERLTFAGYLLGSMFVIWLSGMVGVLAVGQILPEYSSLAGLLFSIIASGFVAAWWILDIVGRLRHNYEYVAAQVGAMTLSDQAATLSYLVIRKVWGVLALISLPLIPLLFGQAVLGGELVAMIGVVLSAPPLTQGAIALVLLGALIYVYHTRPRPWKSLGWAITASIERRLTGFVTFLGAVPLLVALGVALFIRMFGAPWWLVVLAAGLTLILGHRGWRIYQRATLPIYRTVDNEGSPPLSVQIAAGTVDVNGTEVGVARVGRRWLAWTDLDALATQLVADVEARFEGDSPEPTVMTTYYQLLADTGASEPTDAAKFERVGVQKTFKEEIDGQKAPREEVDEVVNSEFDPGIVEHVKTMLIACGKLAEDDTHYYWRGG